MRTVKIRFSFLFYYKYGYLKNCPITDGWNMVGLIMKKNYGRGGELG